MQLNDVKQLFYTIGMVHFSSALSLGDAAARAFTICFAMGVFVLLVYELVVVGSYFIYFDEQAGGCTLNIISLVFLSKLFRLQISYFYTLQLWYSSELQINECTL